MSLKTLHELENALKERPQELEKARAGGAKVVGWFNYNIPEEIIHALGLIPIRLGTGGDDRLVEIGARYISSKNCVFVRQAVGLFAESEDPYVRNTDLVAFDATCLQVYRASEVVQYYFKVKTALLEVPKSFASPEGKEYFRKGVEVFAKRLEDFAGEKLDAKKLASTIGLFNSIRAAQRKLYDWQASDGEPITWREVRDVIHAGYYLDRQKYLHFLNNLLGELKLKNESPVISSGGDKPRLLISGSIIPPGDTKLVELIDQGGGRIVADDLWSGLSPFIDLEVRGNTLNGVADSYINRVPHAALPYLDLKSDRRLALLRDLVDRYKPQGVIYHTLRYCDPYTFKAQDTKNVLSEEKGLPLLEIHTEYAGSDLGAIKTRVEAFLEMIRNKTLLMEAV